MCTYDEKQKINELVKSLKDGNKNALDVLYMKMYRVLFSVLKNISNNEELIKDTIEDTFYALYIKPKHQINYSNCYGLIIKMAQNRILNLIKLNKKYDYKDNDDIEFQNLESPSSRYEGIVEWRMVFDNLPKQEQRLFYLKSINKLKFKEIAKIMHLSETTVKRKYKDFKKYVEEVLSYEK